MVTPDYLQFLASSYHACKFDYPREKFLCDQTNNASHDLQKITVWKRYLTSIARHRATVNNVGIGKSSAWHTTLKINFLITTILLISWCHNFHSEVPRVVRCQPLAPAPTSLWLAALRPNFKAPELSLKLCTANVGTFPQNIIMVTDNILGWCRCKIKNYTDEAIV